MGTPAVIDIEALKAPVSSAAPTGTDLSQHQVSYDLHSLADAARMAEKKLAQLPLGADGKPILPSGEAAPPVANWGPVLKAAVEILREKSKDLSVCSILIEALTRVHGFAGIRDGSRLVQQLAECYWNQVYPPFDQDDFESNEQHSTVARISGLNGKTILPFAIDRIPLIRTSPIGPLSGIDYVDAFNSQTRVTQSQFKAAAEVVPSDVFEVLLSDAEAALSSYREMAETLGRKCQESHKVHGPASSSVEESLEESIRRIRHISGQTETALDGDVSPAAPPGSTSPASGDPAKNSRSAPSVPLQSREEAYEMLGKVAAFFSRAEPHSPVSTALKRIVAWRTLDFAELMKELLNSDEARKDLFRLTGVKESDS